MEVQRSSVKYNVFPHAVVKDDATLIDRSVKIDKSSSSQGEMMRTLTTKRPRSRNLKRRRLEKPGPNWSCLPLDVYERVIERLCWVDRIRIRAVCKAWSVPSGHIPTIDKLPWAMKFRWCPAVFRGEPRMEGECRLLDPLSREYVMENSARGMEFYFFRSAVPLASACGWVLFEERTLDKKDTPFFLYSPFTTEVIRLPHLPISVPHGGMVVAISLNASSPKCIVFVLWMSLRRDKIYVNSYSPGDDSWKTLEFGVSYEGFIGVPFLGDATYSNGVVYCVFSGGELGVFDVEHEEWSILVGRPLLEFHFFHSKLIASDGDIRLLSWSKSLELLKLDFSEKRWVFENNLNNHVIFVGCKSVYAPAVGEMSQLANTIFSSHDEVHPLVRYFGNTCASHNSPLYLKCVEATDRETNWIEVPFGGFWRANDLIHAV